MSILLGTLIFGPFKDVLPVYISTKYICNEHHGSPPPLDQKIVVFFTFVFSPL